MLTLLGHNNKGIAKWMVESRAEDIARELECGGPAGVVCLDFLSKIINKRLRVRSEGLVVGEYGKGDVIEIEYLKGEKVGHWVGPYGDVCTNDNNCLFHAVGSVVNVGADDLRSEVTELLKKGGWLCTKVLGDSPYLLGGARYTAEIPDQAGVIIDNSHGTRGHGHVRKAHPRGHASHPPAEGPEDSVENYSSTGMKSGWLSRADQNVAIHYAMQTTNAVSALESLNRGSTREGFTIHPGPKPPRMAEWHQGRIVEGPMEPKAITVVLQHHEDKIAIPEAEVQIFTCFPRKS